MKILLSNGYHGPHANHQAGETIEVSKKEGEQLVAGHYGTEVKDREPADPAEVAEPTEAKAAKRGKGKSIEDADAEGAAENAALR
jgi:hypothetical protein